MQMTLSLEECARCGHPIRSGEPFMRTSTVDVIYGKAVATPPKTYYMKGGCPDNDGRRERLPHAA